MNSQKDEIKVTTWNFQMEKPKYRDYFLKNEDSLHLTLRQLEALIKQKYLKTLQNIIIFHGKQLAINDSNVSDIFNRKTVNINSQGQTLQICPYKIPLIVFLEEQVADLSQNDKIYYQKEISDQSAKRKKYQELKRSVQFRYEKMIKENQQLCFIIETSKSMKKHVKKVQQVIRKVAFEINNGIYSFILFKNFEQQINNKYQGIGFSCSIRELVDFVENCQFNGDDDLNDLHGALEQSLSYDWNIQNKNVEKKIVVITDMPCHGMNYHSKYIHDDYPNEDLRDTILKIVQQDIQLSVYTFNQQTDIMIEQMQKIVKEINISNAFHHYRINNILDFQDEQSTDLESNKEIEQQQNFRVNLNNSEILRQLSDLLQNFHLNQESNLMKSKFYGQIINYSGKYDCQIEESLRAFFQFQDLIILKEAQNADFTISLKPIIKENKDQIYLVQFNDIPQYEGQLYFTKTERLRMNKQQAIIVLQNQLIANILLENFKKNQSIKPEHPIPDVFFSELILIQINQNEFILCEKYISYPYVQFNTQTQKDIIIQNQNDDLNLFLQYFSYEGRYILDAQDLIVLNLTGFSNGKKTILTDPQLITDQNLIQQFENKFLNMRLSRHYALYS
ncbi:hypothetical protein pb186bvf_013077 [Paramecium bursaria]